MNKIELIKKAKAAYYNTDEPIMSDFEYDKLVEEVGEESVGAPILDSLKKIDISDKPMLSLDKCHTVEEIIAFANSHDLVASIKCDGLSVRIIYEDGKIVSANTRGDGQVGQDITEHIKQFKNVPKIIDFKNRLVVDGEAVILQHDFDEINADGRFKNPRNLAAGTLASLDTSLCKERRLSFIAWDVIEGIDEDKYWNKMKKLDEMPFHVVPISLVTNSNYDDVNDSMTSVAQDMGIPCDGIVWKFNDIVYGDSLGRTAHHFNNGIAWKPAIKEYETTLKDIEWTMGRTGVLTPVAIYDNIDIDGSTCNRASLHNISVMYSTLHLPFENQKIKIFKANEIIPQISWAEDAMPEADFEIPEVCPICGNPTEIKDNDGVKTLLCINPQCQGKLVNRLDHFCSKKGLDIKGLSKMTLEKLIDWGWLESINDIFYLYLHANDWYKKDGFGIKSVENIINSIHDSSNCELWQFISALGIPLIGVSASKELAKKFDSYQEFRDYIDTKNNHFDEFDGFGPEMDKSLKEFDYTEADKIAAILNFKQKKVQSEEATSAAGTTFCITGKVNVWKNRDTLKAYIESIGGKVVGSMSSKVNYLINNDNTSTSAKNVAAKKAGIPIITEAEFVTLFGQNN